MPHLGNTVVTVFCNHQNHQQVEIKNVLSREKTLENKCCNRLGNCQCKSSSEEVEISVKEREEKTTDVSEHGTFGHYISLHIYATISLS